MVSVKEHSELKGFYEVPNHPFIYISKNGVMWDEYFKEYVRPSYSLRPYPEFVPKGAIKPISMHRALALTFLECPGNPKDYQVDHVDGNKSNYSLENLEWVSCDENAKRAFKTGLRHDNKEVLLKDLETGVIQEFYGVNECARFLNIHPGYISTYMKRPQTIPFRGKYEIIRKGGIWIGLTKDDIGKHNGNKPKNVVEHDVANNTLKIHESIATASHHSGIPQSVIQKRIKNQEHISNIRFYYLSDFLGSIEKAKYTESLRKKHMDEFRHKSKPRCIEVINTETQERVVWESVDHFASSLGLNKKTIQKSIKNHGGYKKYSIRYC